MQIWLLILLAGLTAMMLPVQGIINGRLGALLGNPLLAALISFASGTVVLTLVYIAVYGDIPRLAGGAKIPWYYFTGGILGAIFVTVVLAVIPHIGPANLTATAIVGQLIVALLLDHWGFLGIQQHPLSLTRLGGAVLLFAGTILIQRG